MKSISKTDQLSAKRSLNINGNLIDLSKPLIMGIVNMTPDSFYDGGNYNSKDKALKRIEIGGCSTRPGSEIVSIDEEWNRIKDIIRICSLKFNKIIISVDTFRSEIARRSLEEGASIINDVSGGSYDNKMFSVISEYKIPYVLMHIRGTPKNMMSKINYDNLIVDIMDYFIKKIEKLKSMNVNDIILDPGFGFAKDFDQNLELLKNLNFFTTFDLPILVGLSRKSFVKKKYGIKNSLNGTLELNKIALKNGADIIRVHDVKEHLKLIK